MIVYHGDINIVLFTDIVREEERDARGKKSAIVDQSTEMTLYLYDISKLISRKKRFTSTYSNVLYIIVSKNFICLNISYVSYV